jgi:glycosyltransferase involved in cell wall biosynthesis
MDETLEPYRFVWVTDEASTSPRAGGAIRTHRLLTSLAAASDVAVVSRTPVDTAEFARQTGAKDVSVRLLPRRSRAAAKLAGVVRARPAIMAAASSRALRRELRRHADEGRVLVFDHLRAVGNRPRRARCVVVLQNIDSELLRPGADVRALSVRRLTAALERRLAERHERLLARDPAALVVVVSERDRDLLGGDAVVVPNGADLAAVVPPRDPEGTALFVASMSYEPNREAVHWWADRVWPHITDGTRLTVVGRGAEEALNDLRGHEAVDLVGEVADVAPQLAKAAVVVVPLLSGGGSRLKILEAMAWNRPVVTTHKGAEGLPLVHMESALLADDPKEFAHLLMRLRADTDLAGRLAERANEIVRDFSWDRIGRAFTRSCREHAARCR